MNEKNTGRIVMIYEDPMTEKIPEGKARLIKLIDRRDGLEEWDIQFCDDGFKCSRLIKKLPTEQESAEELRKKVRRFTEKIKAQENE